MTFKKLLLLFIVLIPLAYAQETINFEGNSNDYTNIINDNLILNYESYILNLNLPSIPDTIETTILIENNKPMIKFESNEGVITIKQIARQKTVVFYNKPKQDVIETENSLVYVVEHYSPDVSGDDPKRENGVKRLTVIVKNAEVEIDNGIKIRTDGLKISAKSFMEAESLQDKEIDYIDQEKVTEIFTHTDALVIRNYDSFEWNGLFDRGFKLFIEYIEPFIEVIINEEYIEIEPKTCSKFGFVFIPGFGYDYITEVNEFTNNKGYALGIAYSRNDNFEFALKDMILFINRSKDAGITPIVTILGNVGNINQACRDSFGIDACDNEDDTLCNGANVINCNNVMKNCNVWQAVDRKCVLGDKPSNCDNGNYCFGDYAYNEPMPVNDVVEFIEKLKVEGVEYIQIWDSPDEYYFTNPHDYEKYVIEIKNTLNDPDIKLISASIFSEVYFDSLSLEFWKSMDYLGSTAYNNHYSVTLVEHLKDITGKDYEVFITKVGYSNPSTRKQDLINMLRGMNNDERVKSANIFIANYWNKDETNWFTSKENNWIDSSTRKLKPFALDISEEICS